MADQTDNRVAENAAEQDLLLEPVMFDAAFAADVLDHAYDADDTAIDTTVTVETPIHTHKKSCSSTQC